MSKENLFIFICSSRNTTAYKPTNVLFEMLNRAIFLFLLLTLNTKNVNAQDTNISKWEIICKTWGILKYHAPNSEKRAKQLVDWDKILLDDFASIEACKNTKELNSIITNWIIKAGKYEKGKTAQIPSNALDIIDISWIDKTEVLNDFNKEYLKHLRWRKNKKENYYVEAHEGFAPKFDMENSYESLSIISRKYQILALFKFWNVIDEFFPYKNIMSQSWCKTLTDFIPIFLKEQTNEDYYYNLMRLSHFIEDGHGDVRKNNKSQQKAVPPFLISYIKGSQYVTELVQSPNASASLQKGDEIIEINGVEIPILRDSLRKFISVANPISAEFGIDIFLLNEQKNIENRYKIIRNGKDTLCFSVANISVEEWKESILVVKKTKPYELLDNNIGILNMGQIDDSFIENAMQRLKDTKGLIIDLTQYPNNLNNQEKFLSYFIDKNRIDYLTLKVTNPKQIGIFEQSNPVLNLPFSSKYKGRIVVLINSNTQSYSETLAALFKTYTKATFIGTKTACTNGSSRSIVLPMNIVASFSGVWIGFPNGSPYQKIGIAPDIEVVSDIENILNGENILLKAAINFLKKSSN